ncbi:hypothetical protein SAY86_030656 [Trapa natans]|uniref:MATH domain-containing protein n=1 Tax=Trapa natans TaxID=22666 RepID=A0AAN7M380_TRANT|nr:hypothetical protein SAY86_030656 [Trapa natans]
MGEEGLYSGKYAWRIDNFSKMAALECSSEVFTVGGCNWKVLLYPKGNKTDDYLSIYLEVADAATLPDGWCRDAEFTFALLNPCNGVDSMKKMGGRNTFKVREINWGYNKYVPLIELHDHGRGYLVNDTIVVEVKITLFEVVPSVEVSTQMSMLESYFSTFSENFVATGSLPLLNGSASDKQMTELASENPSSDDIEKAKHSLMECLSDLFKLNMRDRLCSAISILSHAQVGLSPGQQTAIEAFKANFDDFLCDFLTFEQDNSDFELQKVVKDQIYSTMKKNHETHLSYKKSLEDMAKERGDLNRKLKELNCREAQLISNWETLMNESKDMKLRYTNQEKKLAEADEKKKIAEERMSRSTRAWSDLKKEFL